MSLQTDIIFVRAIKADETLTGMLAAGDVYNTTIALPDEDLDNAPLPYAIVSFDGLTNDQTTKDDFEGDIDTATVSIEVAARTRQELGIIADKVRSAVLTYFRAALSEGEDDIPYDYRFSASRVSYDQMKPCYWQTLTYQCDILNDINEKNDE